MIHWKLVKNYGIENNEIAKHSWEENRSFDWNQKEVAHKENSNRSEKTYAFTGIFTILTTFLTLFLIYDF